VVASFEETGVDLTFESQPTTWERLPSLLAMVPDRSHTVLEYALASDRTTLAQHGELRGRIIPLAHALGFEYASDVGVRPLGSRGTAVK
jgi:hypothetical protein